LFTKQVSLSNSVSQQLLFPIRLEFTPAEMSLLKSLEKHLVHTGFGFEKFGKDFVAISGIPTMVTESEVSNILEKLILDLQDDVPTTEFSQVDSLTRSLSKSSAIRSGVVMETKEMNHLVNRLFACESPQISPDGKKVFVTLGVDVLNNKF